MMQSLISDPNHDPNINYDKLEKILCEAKEKHLPVKTVKFNKYKHKRSPWITLGILKSIKFRDGLYKKLNLSRLILFNTIILNTIFKFTTKS